MLQTLLICADLSWMTAVIKAVEIAQETDSQIATVTFNKVSDGNLYDYSTSDSPEHNATYELSMLRPAQMVGFYNDNIFKIKRIVPHYDQLAAEVNLEYITPEEPYLDYATHPFNLYMNMIGISGRIAKSNANKLMADIQNKIMSENIIHFPQHAEEIQLNLG